MSRNKNKQKNKLLVYLNLKVKIFREVFKKVSENVIISNFSLNCYFIIIIVINSNINIFILFKKYSIIFFNDQIMKLRIQILRIKKFITNFQRKIKELLLAD